MNSLNWSAPNICVFVAQLVEHRSANAEAMGCNPVEALKIYFGLKFAIAQIAITTAMITFPFKPNKTCMLSSCHSISRY